jgi:hypothetical protein
MTKLTISIIAALAILIAFLFWHQGVLDTQTKAEKKALSEQIKALKRDEMIHKDSITLLTGYLKNVIVRNSRLLDSIQIISTKENRQRQLIKEIKVDNLNSKELEEKFKKRYQNK